MSSSTEGGKANKSGEMGTTILGRPGVCMGEKEEFLSAERDMGGEHQTCQYSKK